MVKKWSGLLAIFTLFTVFGSTVFANPVHLLLDGRIPDKEIKATIVDGRALVEVRPFAEALGAEVFWDDTSKTINIIRPETDAFTRQIALLEAALAPKTPEEAVRLYLEGVKTRNGALQYAVFSEKLKKETIASFQKMGWVTGTSSPWVQEYRLSQGKPTNDGRFLFQAELIFADSTNATSVTPLQLTVEKRDDHYYIADITEEADLSGPSPEGGKSEFLTSARADLLQAGRDNELLLYADLNEEGAPVRWRLLVDGKETIALTQPEPYLYNVVPAELKIEDLDGDQKPEVLVYRFSSGSAGAKGLTVYSPARDWAPLFAIDNPFASASFEATDRYHVAYAGNGQADFRDRTTGLAARLPLDMKNYEAIDAKERDSMLRALSTWIDPVSDYLLVDGNGDGIKEIVTVQRIIGISHPDTIGLLKETYELKDGVYTPAKQAVYDSQDRLLQEVRLPSPNPKSE